MPAITTSINHPLEPSTHPFINLHKKVLPIPLATLSKKRPCSQLKKPVLKPYDCLFHTCMDEIRTEKTNHSSFIKYSILISCRSMTLSYMYITMSYICVAHVHIVRQSSNEYPFCTFMYTHTCYEMCCIIEVLYYQG